jgi:hypothetical protein
MLSVYRDAIKVPTPDPRAQLGHLIVATIG